MKTFTVGQLEIDVLQHRRVDGSRFPRPSPDYIADYFLINARWQGVAIDFYPNQGRPVDPLAFGFIGRKVVPVHTLVSGSDETGDAVYQQTGTKRGGDFRSRFFRVVVRRAAKAVRARQLGKRIGEVTEADIASAGVVLRRALTGDFNDPENLKLLDIDNAAKALRDDLISPLEEGDPMMGTVATIDTDADGFGEDDGGGNFTGVSLAIRNEGSGTNRRAATRFPLGAIPAGATINSVDVQWNTTITNASSVLSIKAYDTGGDDDPAADTNTDVHTKADAGTAYVTGNTGLTTTGSKTASLGATAATDLEGNITSPARYSLGWVRTDVIAGSAGIEAIENAGTDPATLTVDYTAASDPFKLPELSMPAVLARY